jgi:pyroglutamyl-peptidase
MSWLITAFEPFGESQTNSSLITLNNLSESQWNGQVRFFSPVPVTFAEAWPTVLKEAEKIKNLKGILALGQAEMRTRVTPEKLALNWIDARIPDNSGVQIKNEKIDANAAEIIWSNIPWEKFNLDKDIEFSYSAGTYLCNSLMFQILSWCKQNHKMGGFVHFPLLQSQTDSALQKYLPRMPDESAADALRRIIDFLVQQ